MTTESSENTAIVFAVEGSYVYHNGRIRQWSPARMEIEARHALARGDRIVIKMIDFCAVFHGCVTGCERRSAWPETNSILVDVDS